MKTPVAFLIFNRPDTTEKVFQAIRQAQPPQLFVVADGPRPDQPEDIQNCAAARSIIEQVDWDCQVQKNYAEVNLGCGRRIASGLDWVFDTVDRAIVLEDDCLPHPSFFPYCEELLEKYQDDPRIMTILGTNGLGKWQPDKQSYHFSYWPSPVWGWASWSRAWRHYEHSIIAWGNPLVKLKIRAFMPEDALFGGMAWRFEQVYLKNSIDIWDWSWYFAILSNSGLAIVPAVNLVSNLGFGPRATHTKSKRSRVVGRTYPLNFPLTHPNQVAPARDYHKEITKVSLFQKIKAQVKAKLRPYKRYFLKFLNEVISIRRTGL